MDEKKLLSSVEKLAGVAPIGKYYGTSGPLDMPISRMLSKYRNHQVWKWQSISSRFIFYVPLSKHIMESPFTLSVFWGDRLRSCLVAHVKFLKLIFFSYLKY